MCSLNTGLVMLNGTVDFAVDQAMRFGPNVLRFFFMAKTDTDPIVAVRRNGAGSDRIEEQYTG
jgi:hypothetical protein